MKIQQSQLQLASQHHAESQTTSRLSVRVAPVITPANAPVHGDVVALSATAVTAQQAETDSMDLRAQLENDPTWTLVKRMIFQITGRNVDLKDVMPQGLSDTKPAAPALPGKAPPPALQAATPQPLNLQITRTQSRQTSEATSFAAQGSVITADGRQINFSTSFSLARSYRETSSQQFETNPPPNRKDPLVVNFAVPSARLSDGKIQFDIDADGQAEQISFLAPGSGFLTLDKDGNGKVDDGNELFGARSGNGFADLATYDSDHNGWIDESDPIWQSLRVWSRDTAGQDEMSSLSSHGIGALALQNTDTDFALTGTNNADLGRIRKSGVFLSEAGHVGTLQQLDLTV